MQYTETDVSHWFRDELAGLIVATLKEHGSMQKGALIAAVMEKRGLKPYAGNMLMRAHVDELLRRGILMCRRDSTKRPKTTILDLADAAGVEDSSRAVLLEDALVSPRRAEDRKDALANRLLGELIDSMAVRMNEIAENLAVLNEASAVLMRESSVMRDGIAMIAESMNAGFVRVEQAGADRHDEMLRVLSAIREGIVSGDAGAKGYDAILAAFTDLSRKINESDDTSKRLDRSHAILRDLLTERGSAVNHNVGNASGG